MRTYMVVALLAVVVGFVGCSSQPTPTTATTSQPTQPAQNYDALQTAIRTGKLRFEIRGLHNELTTSNNNKSYQHKGTVVALGDESFTSQRYWILLSIKRLKGGNPDWPRDGADVFDMFGGYRAKYAVVLMESGVGTLQISGGYLGATDTDKWEPEQIEVAALSLLPWVPISGLVAAEPQ